MVFSATVLIPDSPCQVLLNAGRIYLRSHLRTKLDAGAVSGTASVPLSPGWRKCGVGGCAAGEHAEDNCPFTSLGVSRPCSDTQPLALRQRYTNLCLDLKKVERQVQKEFL